MIHPDSPRSLHSTGFTLVELLTVIAIIAILMGLLFPVVASIREQARRLEARNTAVNVVAAVRQFQTDYGKYPSVQATPSSGSQDAVVGDAAAKATIDNSALFDTLRAIDRGLNERHALNPRRVPYFEARAASDADAPRGGFADHTGAAKRGCLFDPWGAQYAVVMDTNADNKTTITEQYRDFSGDSAPRVGVGVISMGKDNQLGTKGDHQFKAGTTASDDVISWQ